MQHTKTKLEKSSVFSLISSFNEQVSLFPPAHIVCKSDKREKAVVKAANPLYKYHTAFTRPVNEFGNSVVLVCNDVVVPYMIEEIAQFSVHLEEFLKEIKSANNVQELQLYYKQFTLKPKQLKDALIDDLKRYSEEFNFDIDIKSIVMELEQKKTAYIEALSSKG